VADKPRDVIVPVRFDEETLATDLEHLPDAAGAAVRALRREINRDGGLPKSRLKRCQSEGRDGTRPVPENPASTNSPTGGCPRSSPGICGASSPTYRRKRTRPRGIKNPPTHG
jgi:hypothetical protein